MGGPALSIDGSVPGAALGTRPDPAAEGPSPAMENIYISSSAGAAVADALGPMSRCTPLAAAASVASAPPPATNTAVDTLAALTPFTAGVGDTPPVPVTVDGTSPSTPIADAPSATVPRTGGSSPGSGTGDGVSPPTPWAAVDICPVTDDSTTPLAAVDVVVGGTLPVPGADDGMPHPAAVFTSAGISSTTPPAPTPPTLAATAADVSTSTPATTGVGGLDTPPVMVTVDGVSPSTPSVATAADASSATVLESVGGVCGTSPVLGTVDGAPPPPAPSMASTATVTTKDVGLDASPTHEPLRPALQPEAEVAQIPPPPTTLVPSFARVYSWRPKPQQQHSGPDAAPPVSPVRLGTSTSAQHSSQRRRFLAKITKKTTMILPTPGANRLCSRACAPCAPPRRSRRIAGMEPDTPGGGAPSRAKKKVMRALNLIGETAGIDQQSLEEYSKFFTGSGWLPDNQVLALSALFGWAAPDVEEQDLVVDC